MVTAREHNVHYYREYLDLLNDPKVKAVFAENSR